MTVEQVVKDTEEKTWIDKLESARPKLTGVCDLAFNGWLLETREIVIITRPSDTCRKLLNI